MEVKLDPKTQEFIRSWGKPEMPTAQVVHGRVSIGEYPTFALLGWVEQRPHGWPVVGLRVSVLEDESKVIGGMTLGLPLSPKTEYQVCCLLEDFGWDGRVWPYRDHGWPEGGEDEAGLLGLLRTAKLGATLTFPPHPEFGTPTVKLPVFHSKKPFLVAPFGDGPVVPRYIFQLRDLAANPTPFVSDWGKPERHL